ncbi:MAG: O-antigen ligase family protein [Candidatus Gottesmanbacteria bacterium]
MRIIEICDRVVEFSFYVLFFLTPIIMTPWNYELFEYNKMMLVYGLTTIIVGTWLIKMIHQRRIIFCRTPFDIPIIIFLISQFLSFLFSINPHVSLFGYYSRFNGGLLSTISYLLLYYALVSNFDRTKVLRLINISFMSAFVVAAYGILEHFGIDKNIWVQDVQNRVFSTLGQPNWLAAYLVVLLPMILAYILTSNLKNQNSKLQLKAQNYLFYFLHATFYLCLLFTKSRSGLMAFAITYILFWVGIIWLNRSQLKLLFRPFILLSAVCLLLSILVGTPWTPKFQDLINRRLNPSTYAQQPKVSGPALEVGGTESGEIRKIVWQGAIDIAKHYPLFGSGVETFAYSYYQFRPAAHNLVSEWDFLYNKAHNEYLNYAATTGFVGLGAYLLFIAWFIIWSLKGIKKLEIEKFRETKLKNSSPNFLISQYLNISLLAAWLSILITNFFGFSVVIVALYFYLIPALCYLLVSSEPLAVNNKEPMDISTGQKISSLIVIFAICYLLFALGRMWYADTLFNKGYQLARTDRYQEAYDYYHQAINLNPNEPFYRDEASYSIAIIASAAYDQNEASLAAQLANEAIQQNMIALESSPLNVNFWKTRTKIYYTLATTTSLPAAKVLEYNKEALDSLLTAQKIAPTDPKIIYNTSLIYGKLGKNDLAIKNLEEAVKLKSNYQDARFALALFYWETNKRSQAIDQLKYILKYISPQDPQATKKLQEWGGL